MAAHQAPRPWDSPGKNTGVGCHFLLQCMKVKSESEVAQSCPTLSDPMDCNPPGFSIHGICKVRVLEWGAIAFSACRHIGVYSFWWVWNPGPNTPVPLDCLYSATQVSWFSLSSQRCYSVFCPTASSLSPVSLIE